MQPEHEHERAPDAGGEAAPEAMQLSPIEDIIADYREGRMVILVDDQDRENEGDLLIPADSITAQDINFMTLHGRGLICLTLTAERCRQLGLPLMVRKNNARTGTNFTVSIEAAEGVTTGISAADRATTVRAAVKPDAQPSDLVSPGHIFPLMAEPGGVLMRAGHTEAGVDLARLAGREPASVICEILKSDGSMARMPDLVEFSREHAVKVGTIADLIRYRLEHEPTVHRVAETRFATQFGEFAAVAYHDVIGRDTHVALVAGEVRPDDPVLVRVHVHTGLYDVLADARRDYPWPIRSALRRIGEEGAGVLVVLHSDEGGDGLVQRIRRFQRHDRDIELPWEEPGGDLRMLGVGSQILADLGVGRMRVMGNPKKVHGLSGFGLEIADYVADPDWRPHADDSGS